MAKFRKNPVVIEAAQWFKNGDHPEDYAGEKTGFENGELRTWSGEECRAAGWEGQVVRYYRNPIGDGQQMCVKCGRLMHEHGFLDTLEGKDGAQVVCPGDWIITGVKGERYPCKPDIFKATYDPIIEPPASVAENLPEPL